MFDDLVAKFTTHLSPSLRALGYLEETLDMRRRARLNHLDWQMHLDNSRHFMLTCADRCTARQKVVILGSGLLLDVPLDELTSMFSRVELKDVVCLPEVRRQIRGYRNVTFIEHDVTGLAVQLNHGITSLPDIPPPAGHDEADLIVSLNILSQLWVVPRAFVGQHVRQLDPADVDDWCARIVAAHYDHLRSHPGNVCLVADFEALKRDRSGGIVSRMTTVYGLALPPAEEIWTWNIAPITSENPHTWKELVVGAWYFPKRS
jgi:hypothetical protein